MAKETKYGIPSLKRDFPTDTACLEYIFDAAHNRTCSCGGRYSLMKNSRKFQCSKCRFKISPTAETVFDHSPTPLTLWFQAVLVFSNAKSGISAKEMERQLEVTYKCAYRILMLIRKSLAQSVRKLKGDVEMDETYFGGRFRSGKYNVNQSAAIKAKSVIIGAVERGGAMRAKVSPNTRARTIGGFLLENVERDGTRLLTDESNRYNRVARGYDRHSVNHGKGEYARYYVHVSNIESFWGHIKRSIRGTHKVISRKCLQSYLDGFVFHYNNRSNDRERFASLLGILVHASR